MFNKILTIRQQFTDMCQNGKARQRDIAEQLNISEGELIAAHVNIENVNSLLQATRLQPYWSNIIESLEPLGEVMALTRNASCVHEKVGIYHKASHRNNMGLVLGDAIDLRIFYDYWAYGFAVTDISNNNLQYSLQFFDAEGTAIHKIFLKPQSNKDAYLQLVTQFADEQQCVGIEPVIPQLLVKVEKANVEIDVIQFRQAWADLHDTHDFSSLLKKFGVSRIQGLQLANPEYTRGVALSSAYQILDSAAQLGVPMMIFVANSGVVQIHTGTVHKIVVMEPWLNVLDDGFNLHLRQDYIASAWVVCKPTDDGVITSLELFDEAGHLIAMFFGERKSGQTERSDWRNLVEHLS